MLFPNTGAPGMTFYQYGDPEFELDAVRACDVIWVATPNNLHKRELARALGRAA